MYSCQSQLKRHVCLSHVWAHTELIFFLLLQGKFVIFVLCQKKKSSRQTLNQNLFHNPKCDQMIFKHFLASNFLLSCFSLNKFKMLSVQVCWHTA